MRIRTVEFADGSKHRLYVFRKKGPHGGHTMVADVPITKGAHRGR